MAAIRGLLIDIEGVLKVGTSAIDGAPEALDELRRRALPVRFVTNTTSRTRASLVEVLGSLGFEVVADELVTAPAATAAYLRSHHPGERVYLVSDGDVVADLDGIDVTADTGADAQVVVIGGAGPAFTWERLNHAFGLLDGGAAFVAMHKGSSWQTDDGLALDSGAFVTGLESVTGREATVMGKPSPTFFATALDELGLDAGEVAMVGDDIRSDVLAAQANGLVGIQVRTGKFRESQLDEVDEAPDHVIDSFADLPALLDG
ncbi:MAG: TIGR01458 family HAD-type hydrolase [Actinomycetota bacterium]|nr:TIGR01458 family HAD-type hydrolase [Actinomycetota bacterium]